MTADPGPSFPTLLAGEARASITEYLSTTFALADTSAREALEVFLGDPERGIFRGPYLQVRMPYQQVDGRWRSPLGWLPAGFTPFHHQAEAFARLSTRDRPARPTIVTTGTGSGKTEAFLLPLLDHARRAKARGETGIKAIVLYPMNALVTDQARRLANLLYDEPALSQVTAGVYIGGAGTHATRTRDQLVDQREVLRQDPPDILLTNYKMLDLLLLRAADAPLWAASVASLQFVVLDEFHTYDGAQGTDVAMLLRRLGATARVAEAGRPLGRITPVATSATLGGSDRSPELRDFAERIFGVPFGPDALVGEQRLAADDVVPDVDFNLAIPEVDAILAADTPRSADPDSWRSLAEAVLMPPVSTGDHVAAHDYTDRVEIGNLLRRHFLTRVVVESLAERPLTPAEAVTRITRAGVLPWGVRNATDDQAVEQALVRFLALLSAARVLDPHGIPRPLVTVQAQLWVRELTRMLRRVDASADFAWWHDAPEQESGWWLPAAHCRVCGRSGWIATVTELGDSLGREPVAIWRASARYSTRSKTRTLLLAGADEDGVRFLDPTTLELSADPRDDCIAVLVTGDGERAQRQECPSCGSADAIRFLGSSVATLLSVGLTQLFGSDLLPDAEKKTLVFTDSVQDAAHRAAFIEGRAFQFNFRSALLGAAGSVPKTLAQTADALTANLPVDDLYAVTPPDFVRRKALTGAWLSHDPRRRLRRLLATRIAFQAHLELGLNSRLGRTLELTGALAVDVDANLADFARLAREVHNNLPEHNPLPGSQPGAKAYERWLLGLLEHLRTRGGIHHRWLDQYVADDGKRWTIWGRSADGMPKFPWGRPAPGFFTTGPAGSTAFVGLNPRGDSWVTDWTRRCLGTPTAEARALLAPVIDLLSGEDRPLERRTSGSAVRIYGLRPERIVLRADPAAYARFQCPLCQHLQPAAVQRAALWDGAPCPRLRCEGRLARVPIEPVNFYRSLYRSGRIRRIVTHEHTGLLDREQREDIERRFKSPTSPIDPNMLTCTPTLELGIDIGDLSTVALASLPRATANYLQRVGRAGRSTGNAFVLTAVPSSPRDLYYFAEPRHLIAGDVVPPGAYLDATELLQRQFFAFCLDRISSGDLAVAKAIPNRLGMVFTGGMDDDAWLRIVVDAVVSRGDELATAFLDLYGTALGGAARQAVRVFAAGGIRDVAAQAALDWTQRTREITERMRALATTITELQDKGTLGDLEKEDLKRCRGESKGLQLQLRSLREQETLTGLAGVGLLPNYNLLDDATTLDVHLWWTSGEEGDRSAEAMDITYERGSRSALTELAPGAFFYADGKRVEIDAVDVGPADQPLWRTWRLCPSCGWGTDDLSMNVVACPRCGTNGVTDTGALHQVLPLRRVSAVHRLDDVVIDDDHDQRSRTYFTTVTGVDIEPADIVRAWQRTGKVFGAEYARRAVVRTVNVGQSDSPGPDVDVAGETVTAPRFTTCAHCGVVRAAYRDDDSVRHRGFCATRRGTPPRWEQLVLSHELTTQAVRLLLPVSTLMVETKLVSFQGALLLGLREDFGGDPQHLSVVTSTMRARDDQTRRFLVLHDTVPGGTGYLDRFGEPDRLREILVKARDLLAGCPCQGEARAACHRCLLGVVRPGDVPSASRQVALDLLEDLLDDWAVEEIATVEAIDIAPVQLSELELTFRESIKAWLDAQEGCSYDTTLGPTGEQLDIRLVSLAGEPRRWSMRPLVTVTAGAVTTQPDFVLTRSDAQGCDVAVYLDGRHFHASVAHNITAEDATKRAALRDHGWRTWSMTWADVQSFATPPKNAEGPDLVVPEVQNVAAAAVGDLRVRQMWSNPVRFLLAYLADPDAPVWGAGATQTLLAMVPPGKHGDFTPVMAGPASLASVLADCIDGSVAGDGGPLALVPRRGRSGLPLVLVADPGNHLASLGVLAVLDDRASEVGGPAHEAQWRDWLRWSTVVQFLTLPLVGQEQPLRMAEVWTRRSLDVLASRYLPLALGAPPKAVVIDTVMPAWQVVLDYTHPGVHALVSSLADEDRVVPEPGGEVGDDEVWQVELCWPDQKIAVTLDHHADRDGWLSDHAWRIARVEEDTDPAAAAAQIEDWLGRSVAMSTSVVLSDLFGRAYADLDGSLKSRVMDFVVKLQRDPTSTGLDLKAPAGVQDQRVRTARVNDSWRAVLFALPDAAGYILVAVKPHDDAYAYAGSLVASVNEVTGALEILNTARLGTALKQAAAFSTTTTSRLLSSVRKRDLLTLGVQDDVADQLLAITDEDTLLAVADALPRSQGDAVLDLYSGLSPEEVWANLVADEPVGAVDTADLTAALARPLSRLSFTDLAGDDGIEELRAVLEGSLAAWRVWLHPLQRRLATHDGWNGPFRVTGGAGTGKTVTALHRARHLARRGDGPVLLTTFTRNLADTLRAQLVQLAGPSTAASVDVLNLDALAMRVLRSSDAGRGLVERSRLVGDSDDQVTNLWEVARRPTDGDWTASFLRDEWLHVVLANQVTTEAGYLTVSRSGRGQRLSRPQRAQLWRVFEQFGQLMRAQGLVTFTQLVSEAALLLIADGTVRGSLGYTHAVIDEAQDLHPAHWRLLRALIPAGRDDLFIVGDAHQRIYGRPVPLSRFGIETRGRSRRLTVNYRTSRQILRWSLRVVDPETDDLDGAIDTLAGARSLFDGPDPTLGGYPTTMQANAALVEQIHMWVAEGIGAGEIAVFVREGRTVAEVLDALKEAGLPAAEISSREDRSNGDVVRVMTMHRAKGLEFRAIALPRMGAAEFPPPFVRFLAEDDARSAVQRERNLLYVAGSRARERLWVSWTAKPSPLLPRS